MAYKGKVVIELNDGKYIYEFNKEDVIYTKITKREEYNEYNGEYTYSAVVLNIYLKTQKEPITIVVSIHSKTTLEKALETIYYFKNLCN